MFLEQIPWFSGSKVNTRVICKLRLNFPPAMWESFLWRSDTVLDFCPHFVDEKQRLGLLNLCVSVTGEVPGCRFLDTVREEKRRKVGLGGGWGRAELWYCLNGGPSQGHRVLWGWKGPLGRLSWEDRLRALFPWQSIIWWERPWKEMSPWLFSVEANPGSWQQRDILWGLWRGWGKKSLISKGKSGWYINVLSYL